MYEVIKIIADDMKDQLIELSDDCLIAIIGYCEGVLDCRKGHSRITYEPNNDQ